MRGRPVRGAVANAPKISASPGTIKKYMTQDTSKDCPSETSGAKSRSSLGQQKNGQRRYSETVTIRESEEVVADPHGTTHKDLPPSKTELLEMFSRLELSISRMELSLKMR